MDIEKAKKIWNNICVHMNENRNSSEKELQKNIELLFTQLGWSKFDGEMISQKTILIGSAQRLTPDIILKNNGDEIIVIELKKPNKSNSDKTKSQLDSYMCQLKLKFGIFIGENLQFYYDTFRTTEKSKKVFETDFIEDSEKAVEFISLIGKPFKENRLVAFCKKNILKSRGDENRFEKLRTDINSGVYDSEVKKSFIRSLKNKYNEQIVNKISDEIEIKIWSKKSSVGNEKLPNRNFVRKNEEEGKAPPFNFDKAKIDVGTLLVFTENEKEVCTVESSKTVRYRGTGGYTLTKLGRKLTGKKTLRGPEYFKVKGEDETLKERRDRVEGKKLNH